MQKREYIELLKEQVKSTRIEQIASLRLDLVKMGRDYKALCPFHADQSIGSFVIGGYNNKFKCFACGESGDGIDLIGHIDGIKFPESVIVIAEELGYITREQAQDVRSGSKENWNASDISTEHYRPFEATDTPAQDIAEPDVLNNVFQLFSEGNSLIGENKLTKSHQDHLMNVRGMSEEVIASSGFFTMPKMGKFMKVFYSELYNRHGYLPDILEKVPGFYSVTKWKVDAEAVGYPFAKEAPEVTAQLFVEHEGIGIPIKDVQGRIVGIQVRNDGGKYRYVWFSSVKMLKESSCSNATGSGAPKDIVYPSQLKNRTLFITEGKFKAIKMSETFGSVVVSIQGVSSWRGIESLIPEMEEKIGYTFNHIVIAYDADMAYNEAVLKMTAALGGALNDASDATIHVAVWDAKLGKGIDDLIDNGHMHRLSKVAFSDFKKQVDKMLEEEKEENYETYYVSHILPVACK